MSGLVCLTACAVLPVAAQQKPSFQNDIQPIFEKSCYSCHGPKVHMGNLRLDSKQTASRTLSPGHAAESALYQRVAGLTDQPRMPMGGKLTPEQIAIIKSWIDSGAEWPENGTEVSTATAAAPKKHWAFIPPVRPKTPEVQDAKWARNEIDRFILARLDKEGLKPSAEAAKATLLRRLSLDLIGLPPTLEELDAFLKDSSPNAL